MAAALAPSYQARVAKLFRIWLKKNPKATRKEKIDKFDEIVDAVIGQ